MPTTRARRIVSGSPRGGTTGTTNLSTRFFFSFVLLLARHSLFACGAAFTEYNVLFYWRPRAHHVGAIRCSPRNAEEKLPPRQVFHTVFHRNCERSVTRDRWLT